MASGGMVLVKYLMFFFNFIFWLSGLALIIVGAAIKLKYGDFIQVSSSSVSTGPVFLIIIGAIIFIVGFLGCCGAYKENYCMVTTFAVLLALIFVLEIAAGAVAYAFRGKLETYVKKGLEDGVDKYNETLYKKSMDAVQKELQCCGADGPGDYDRIHKNSTKKYPTSCCNSKIANCSDTIIKNMYQEGCVKGLEDFLKSHLAIVGGVGVGIAFIQLIGILFACCLMRSIKKEYEVV